jgi:hypothetical protein
MKKFTDFLTEARAKKLLVKSKTSGSMFEVTNNIFPKISIDLHHNHDEGMDTGGSDWSSDTPYEFKKFCDKVSEGIYNKNEYSEEIKSFETSVRKKRLLFVDLTRDMHLGYLDWSKGETRLIVNSFKEILKFYLRLYMIEKGMELHPDDAEAGATPNAFYLYFRLENKIYAGYKAKKRNKSDITQDPKGYMLKDRPETDGKLEIISYKDAVKLNAIDLDKFK